MGQSHAACGCCLVAISVLLQTAGAESLQYNVGRDSAVSDEVAVQ